MTQTKHNKTGDDGKSRAGTARLQGESDAAWRARMARDYPFFSVPELLDGDGRQEGGLEDAAAAFISVGDPGALERIAEPDGMRFDGFYPAAEVPEMPDTNRAIDKFLATYGNVDDAETETLEKLIFNPVADYSQQLAREEENSLPSAEDAAGDSQDDRINRFILSSRGKVADTEGDNEEQVPLEAPRPEPQRSGPAREHTGVKNAAVAPDNSLLSESLAKIYIKTRRYERAYEILSRLSLAFPEKNAYFADQLRFLRKLMVAESYRQQRGTDKTETE